MQQSNLERELEFIKIESAKAKLCQCGCGEIIVIKRHHQWRGIPNFIRGHSSRINNPMTGTHPSNETRKKLSASHIGKTPRLGHKSSEATKKKIGEASKKAWLDPEYRTFHEQMNIGRTIGDEQRKRISEANTGRIKSSETCRKISEGNKGKIVTEETREKLSKKLQGRVFSDAHRKKISDAKIENFKDPDFCKKMGIAWGIKPNKPEKLLLTLLNRLYPNEWQYTGDFSFTINGKCPDFVNCNGQKKCIELFGSYWHEGENPQDRIDLFKPFGFSTLVIWEHELKNINYVVEKICEFHKEKIMAKITLDLSKYDMEFFETALGRVENAANVIRDNAKPILKGKLIGNWTEHGPYQTGQYAGKYWTERYKQAMVKTIRTVRSYDKLKKNVFVIAGTDKTWWAIQMEYGHGNWKGGARSFMRPALRGSMSKIVSVLEGGL